MKTFFALLISLFPIVASANAPAGTTRTFSCTLASGGTIARATEAINMYHAYQVANLDLPAKKRQNLIIDYANQVFDKQEFVMHGYRVGEPITHFDLHINMKTDTGTFSYYDGQARSTTNVSNCNFK